ncbi:hypothetical protein EV127DRAFT_84090 [Xylaria flabelliformis]|nr:hypothetical protein EV127DRAFT_84090 [Xylaria flabelliformis]
MTVHPDPYKVLGVPRDAQIPEIRSAHRKLVLKCHPDKIQDPALKEAKQVEFQQVQQAYELLSNEVEREKYDRKFEVYEHLREREKTKTSTTRTPSSTPKQDPIYYNVKEASPRSNTFANKSSPYGRTPPRSWEDTTSGARMYEETMRYARKTASYEKEKPSKRDEERRRRKEDEEWAREKEKERAREREREREREVRKARERKEEKDRVAREEREKEKRKEEKKKAHNDRDKERGKERKSAAAEKHRSRQTPIIEEIDEETSDSSDSSEDDVVYEPPPKTDRKKSSSGRKPEDIQVEPPSSDRTRKYSGNMESAIRYLTRSGGKAPVAFARAQTFTEGSSKQYNTPAVPTPPPASNTPFAPPPPQVNEEPEEMSDDDDVAHRSQARPSVRRMSQDTPKSSKEKPSSHKKSSSSRDHQPIIVETGSPRTIPSIPRAHTESYARPIPVPPGLSRAETWYPKTDRERDRNERSRSRPKPAMFSEDEDSEDDRERRHRRSRHTQSPDPISRRYAVDGTGTKSIPIRQKQYHDQPPRGAYKTSKAYVMPNSSARVQRAHKSYSRDYYEDERPQHFPGGVKYSHQFDERDIRYSDLPYGGSSSYHRDVLA